MVPAVRGGSNFNPWLSPRVFGPKAAQLYTQEALYHGLDLSKDLAGRKRGCK
jgi:hypothetical protein